MKQTAGVWDPQGWPVYFAASNLDTLDLAQDFLKYLLIAVNELKDKDVPWVEKVIAAGKSVLIDSGVYALAARHAETHNVSHDIALGMAPDDIDGFDELFARYTGLIASIGDKSWGYIEIDQGGKANKKRTRKRLEGLGFRPIPVYHPINDGWEYFDELASEYDRICLGNIVNADIATRKRLIATAWERRRKYPQLWIHALGLTPSELTVAYPLNSCDSSTWIGANRWASHTAKTATGSFARMPREFIYRKGEQANSDRSRQKGVRLCAYDATVTNRIMTAIALEERDELGADIGLFG